MKKCPECGTQMMRDVYKDRFEDICLRCHFYSVIVNIPCESKLQGDG